MNRQEELEETLAQVKSEIAEAAQVAGRDPAEIHLVAVSKTYPAEDLAILHGLGCHRFGENRVQELLPKMEELEESLGAGAIQWDLIGTLQRNKVKYIAGKVELIHSVDRLSLAEEIQRICKRDDLRQDVLLQVNISGEESKHGLEEEDELKELVDAVLAMENLRLRGLMTMAPYTDNPEAVMPIFERCRELFEMIRGRAGEDFDSLSMGMSQDFTQAIRAGATHVRVGSRIFGKRNYA